MTAPLTAAETTQRLPFDLHGDPKNWIFLTGAVLLLPLILILYFAISGQPFWRHDELIYLQDYFVKLRTEGRWLNYYAFDFLKALPPLLSWYLVTTAWTVLGGLLFADISRSKAFGALAGLAIGLNSGLLAQSFWPSTMLFVPYILLTIFALTRDRFRFSVYIVGAILLFGSLSSAVFLFPLFWARQIREWSLLRNAGLLVFWLAVFGLGAFCAVTISEAITDIPMHIARWRIYNDPENFSDYIQNLKYFSGIFQTHISALLPQTPIWLLAFVAALAAMLVSKTKTDEHAKSTSEAILKSCFWGVCIFFACHLQAVALGIYVAYRTSWIMLLGVLLLTGTIVRYSSAREITGGAGMALTAILIVCVGFNGAIQVRHTMLQFRVADMLAEDIKAQLEETNSVKFADYDQIVFYGYQRSGVWDIDARTPFSMAHQAHDEGLSNSSYRWSKAFLNYRTQQDLICFKDNRPNRVCSTLLSDRDAMENWNCGSIYRGFCTNVLEVDNSIVLRIPTPNEVATAGQ